jgi:ribosomal protein S18 acetylase RimI-like enzyme
MMSYREAALSDVAGMAQVRAHDWGSEEYWQERITLYLSGQLHPREAMHPRIAFVCMDGDQVAGLIAGHLTRRFGCDGELEWISVRPEYRGQKIASHLLCLLAGGFAPRGRAESALTSSRPTALRAPSTLRTARRI